MSECSSTYRFLSREKHEIIKLQCRLEAGHDTFHKAYYGDRVEILW